MTSNTTNVGTNDLLEIFERVKFCEICDFYTFLQCRLINKTIKKYVEGKRFSLFNVINVMNIGVRGLRQYKNGKETILLMVNSKTFEIPTAVEKVPQSKNIDNWDNLGFIIVRFDWKGLSKLNSNHQECVLKYMDLASECRKFRMKRDGWIKYQCKICKMKIIGHPEASGNNLKKHVRSYHPKLINPPEGARYMYSNNYMTKEKFIIDIVREACKAIFVQI